jgi:hypothetical protein
VPVPINEANYKLIREKFAKSTSERGVFVVDREYLQRTRFNVDAVRPIELGVTEFEVTHPDWLQAVQKAALDAVTALGCKVGASSMHSFQI